MPSRRAVAPRHGPPLPGEDPEASAGESEAGTSDEPIFEPRFEIRKHFLKPQLQFMFLYMLFDS